MVIYADEVFVINLAVNYLVLLASSKLCAISASRWRMASGAALGGLYAVFALVTPFLRHPVVKVAIGVLMTMVSFGGHRRLLRIILAVFGISAAFAGVTCGLSLMTGTDIIGEGYISVSLRMLIMSFGICYLAAGVVFKRLARTASETVTVTVGYRGKSVRISALVDTGHSLSDPLTGKPVLITGAESVAPLFEKGDALYLPPAEAVERLVRSGHPFRLIIYNAVGVESGLLAAFHPDSVAINGKTADCIIAISPNNVSDGGAYSALIGACYD